MSAMPTTWVWVPVTSVLQGGARSYPLAAGRYYRFAVVVPSSWTSDQAQALLESRGWDVKGVSAPPDDVKAALATMTAVGVAAPAGWWVNATWRGADDAQLPDHDGQLFYTLFQEYVQAPASDVGQGPPLPAPPPSSSSSVANTLAFLGGIAGAAAVWWLARSRGPLREIRSMRLARNPIHSYSVQVKFKDRRARNEFKAAWIERTGGPPVYEIVNGVQFAGDDAERAEDIANEIYGVTVVRM